MVFDKLANFFLGEVSTKSIAILDISLILIVVLVISIFMRLLKQPPIMGYIISGILVGPIFFNFLEFNETISIFSEMGIAFLLFIVGLHLSPRVIKDVGKISVITGIGQVLFTAIITYGIALMFGFPIITSLYIAIAMTFSSTIIIMKLLSDKNSLEKLYGKISIGFLLVQDLIAMAVLIAISTVSSGLGVQEILTSLLLKGVIVIIALAIIGYFILPKLSEFLARSQELLFLFSITWGLSIGALFYFLGFSIEVGALIAGIVLSNSNYSYEISAKLKPLRDFFIISFFLVLGSQMIFADLSNFILPAIVFSLFILIGNPIIVMSLMGFFGYRRNTSFMSGLTVAQISEFSLIIIALGIKVGHIPQEILSLVTIIAIITIAGSTYMIKLSDKIYPRISKHLNIFERKHLREKAQDEKNYEYFLLGENRIGYSIMNSYMKLKDRFIVIDYNPERIKNLKLRGIDCLYGDISDPEFLDDINLTKAKMVVSTVPDIETNLLVINKIKHENKKTIVIVASRKISEALELYGAGADYVILPHFLGGDYVGKLIEKNKENSKEYYKERTKHISELRNRLEEGHEHPKGKRDYTREHTI